MKSINANPSMAGMIALGMFAAFALLCPRLSAGDDPPRPLPENDRQALNEYLGGDVVGEAIGPPALVHGINDLISLRGGLSWRMRVISGKGRGTEQTGTARMLTRPNGGAGFMFDLGDGRHILYGQLDSAGNLLCYASQDNQEGVISRYVPAQPLFLAGLAPGESRDVTCNVSVADLSQPQVQTHSGKLDVEFTYVGAYRLRVPAGTMDAVLMRTRLAGKVGPADVHDTIYRFFAKDRGPVAVVESTDVSAILIYHEKMRMGKVLVETMGN
jgi:hypothetical protein